MTEPIRFDASADSRVDEQDDEWHPGDAIWYLTDGNSNGRWLVVGHSTNDGLVPLVIQRVYNKYLSPNAARDLAAVLLQAADEAETAGEDYRRIHDERDAAYRRCKTEFAGRHDWGADHRCTRCGSAPETVAYSMVASAPPPGWRL